MSYTSEDFFNEYVVPKMKELFAKEVVNYEEFISVIKNTREFGLAHNIRWTKFADDLLRSILNPFQENKSAYDIVLDFFAIHFDNEVLKKLVYTTINGATVTYEAPEEKDE